MEVRLTALAHDSEYFIDSAVECGEISSAAYLAVRLYGSQRRIDAILEPEDGLPSIHGRRSCTLGIERYGAELIAECDPARRYALVLAGCLSIVRAVDDLAGILASWNFEDQTKGGAMKPFLRRVRLERDQAPTKRVGRRLNSHRAARRYARRSDEGKHLRNVFETLVRSLPIVELPHEAYAEECRAIDRDLDRQREEIRLRVNNAVTRMLAEDRGHHGGPKVRIKKEWTRRERHRRIKRSAAVAAAIVGSAAVSAFSRGEPVVVTGSSVAFAIERVARLDTMGGHGSINVKVLDLGGANLGRLCIFQDKTPPLDQLASIALHVAAGEEEHILDTGNLFALQPEATTHPVLAARVQRKAEGRAGYPADERALFDLQREIYTARMRPIYREALRYFVFGPRAKHIGTHLDSFLVEA